MVNLSGSRIGLILDIFLDDDGVCELTPILCVDDELAFWIKMFISRGIASIVMERH